MGKNAIRGRWAMLWWLFFSWMFSLLALHLLFQQLFLLKFSDCMLMSYAAARRQIFSLLYYYHCMSSTQFIFQLHYDNVNKLLLSFWDSLILIIHGRSHFYSIKILCMLFRHFLLLPVDKTFALVRIRGGCDDIG